MPLSWLFFTAALGGALYQALAVFRLLLFALRPVTLSREFLPSMTVLKPIAGMEANLYDNLASFCNQDYDARYDIIFCLPSANDSALSIVQRVAADFDWCPISIAIGITEGVLNPKIANLAKPGVDPQGDVVVIADSDVCVDRHYLRALSAAFTSQRVGAATCLYSGTANETIISRLGALQLQDEFAPSVLVASALGKMRFCLGATMAVRRRLLDDAGGLSALGASLADDHKLGELIVGRGYDIELSRYTVATEVGEKAFSALWSHELRWARTQFALAPAGYVFSFLMYGLPLALLYLVVSRNLGLGVPLVALVAALRIGVHYLSRSALNARRDDLWLVAPRDFLSLAIWAVSLFGRTVRWRERNYTINR